MNPIRPIDPVISFKNSQGETARGTLTNIQRRSLVMEVYNPYSIVQVSEVLSDLTIRAGSEQVIYQGKAFINGLVNTGLMAIVSVTLIDEWSEFHAIHQDLDRVKTEAETFVQEWDKRFKVSRDYQIVVSELHSFLTETARWVAQAELSGTLPRAADGRLREDVFYDLATPLMQRGQSFLVWLEEEAGKIDIEQSSMHRSYAQTALHPLLLRAPFVYRTFAKPLGYAGDYEMVNQILGDPRQGPNAYFQIINTVFLKCAVAEAHRNRINILVKYLSDIADQAPDGSPPLRILNIACGPAVEVQRFVAEYSNPSKLSFTLLDFSQTTLDYTKSCIDKNLKIRNIKSNVNYIHDSVHELLKRSTKNKFFPEEEKYDVIYCAGLFDYLSDKVCTRLLEYFHQRTVKDGKILFTNVHSSNPQRNGMEHLLEWHLIYRDEASFESLYKTLNIKNTKTYTDITATNIFGELIIG
jgi:extracellular factor (EF) 3-hydroxypalmitic acid methyl ester biosynthesis protein